MRKDTRHRSDLLRLAAALILASVAGRATAATFELPPEGTDVIGAVSTVVARHDDTLIDIARAHGFGYEDLVRANPGVNPWVPGEGTEIVLPGRFVLPAVPRSGIVVNAAEFRMYYFPPPKAGEHPVVMTFAVSIGRQDWATPVGTTRVVQKTVNPTWYPPQSVLDEHEADGRPLPRIVPPGPDNPLGAHAMRLDLPGYLIHGTNRPAGVGMRVTHGCVRMFPEDIEFLFERVPVNTKVRIINEPVKFGWDGDEIIMEVHPTLVAGPVATSDVPLPGPEGDTTGSESTVAPAVVAPAVVAPGDPAADALAPAKDPLTSATEQFIAVTGDRSGELDWTLVESAIGRADGLPVAVGSGIKNAATSAASE
jgi:L,D-transpeptidase ErfK/SrfK